MESVDITHLKCVAVIQRASSNLAEGTFPKLSFEQSLMTDEELTQAFLDYWAQSYPMAKPIQHAINTHVGFGRYLLNLQDQNSSVDSDA